MRLSGGDLEDGLGVYRRWVSCYGSSSGDAISGELVGVAVRATLYYLSTVFPGKSVEVRVPFCGAVQCIAGSEHRRGTPPNVVEMDGESWLKFISGMESWDVLVLSGCIDFSGAKADISGVVSIFEKFCK